MRKDQVQMGGETYLDLTLLLNGLMDAFLLLVTGRVLGISPKSSALFYGTLLGEVPILLALSPFAAWLTLCKVLISFLMVWVVFPTKNLLRLGKTVVVFWLLSAGLGGFVYALWGWLNFQGVLEEGNLRLALKNSWLLPVAAFLWWRGQLAWKHWNNQQLVLDKGLYDLEIDFGEGGGIVEVKALLDTGNHLRDPLNNHPVLLLEEAAAAALMPEKISRFLQIPWQESPDPWPLLWKGYPELLNSLVFIPYQGIGRQSWLLGVRPHRIFLNEKTGKRELAATIALVQQVLSSEGNYQALIHPEHILKGGL
ncbi:MAG: sigma-E processing peptidase SpoIIGA [Desulfitobacteriaceae bacterium]|nr:sigma-E processing peptidase SpoIIGA [Desulfitobacteriaceae bacterium]MDD4400776.1 sigma-E processing peptidase SpoIIGA [Desulfitobacteriaceae bacterium]